MGMLKALWGVLDGYKTDLVSGAAIVLAVIFLQDIGVPVALLVVAGALGVAALRDAIRKIEGRIAKK